MYVPKPFAETDHDTLFGLIEAHSFGLLVSTDADGVPVASHIPFMLDRAGGPNGSLRAHLARANPQWRDWTPATTVLAVFRGPHAYLSPGWYDPANNAVPTWNYAVVHAYGTPRLIDDLAIRRAQQEEMTDHYEASRAEPWRMDSQPETYVEAMLKGIAAFEIPIDRLEGKFKLSQNHPTGNRRGAMRGLREEAGDEDSVTIAGLMAEREPKDG